MKNLLILVLSIFLLTGCETGGDFTYIIDNKSDFAFELYFKAQLDMGPSIIDTTLNISPHQIYNFHTVKTVNAGATDFQDQFLMWYDTISLDTKNDTLTLVKDFRNRENWTFSTDNKKYGADSEYLFTIENNDVSQSH